MLAQFSVTRAPGLLGSKAGAVQSRPLAIIEKEEEEKSRSYHQNHSHPC